MSTLSERTANLAEVLASADRNLFFSLIERLQIMSVVEDLKLDYGLDLGVVSGKREKLNALIYRLKHLKQDEATEFISQFLGFVGKNLSRPKNKKWPVANPQSYTKFQQKPKKVLKPRSV